MAVMEFILTSVVGYAIKHAVKSKLGDYSDPDNLLGSLADDAAHHLAVTAVLSGGSWLITQVIELEPSDPRLERLLDAAMEEVKQEKLKKKRIEEEVEKKRQEQFRVYNELFQKVKGLETILYKKGKSYSIGGVASDLLKLIMFEGSPFGFFWGMFQDEPNYSYKKKVNFSYGEEADNRYIVIGLNEDRILIEPLDNGKVKYMLASENDVPKVFDSAEPAMKLITKTIAQFLQGV